MTPEACDEVLALLVRAPTARVSNALQGSRWTYRDLFLTSSERYRFETLFDVEDLRALGRLRYRTFKVQPVEGRTEVGFLYDAWAWELLLMKAMPHRSIRGDGLVAGERFRDAKGRDTRDPNFSAMRARLVAEIHAIRGGKRAEVIAAAFSVASMVPPNESAYHAVRTWLHTSVG